MQDVVESNGAYQISDIYDKYLKIKKISIRKCNES